MKHYTDHFTEDGKINNAVNEETKHWPVLPQLREELNKIKFEYYAVPLSVYADNNFVKLALINNAIWGALVELHFEFHHFAIQRAAQDSFNAPIEQILILCPGEACPMTVYKRKNPRDSPIIMKLTVFPAPQPLEEGSAGGNNDESATNKENEGPSTKHHRVRAKVVLPQAN